MVELDVIIPTHNRSATVRRTVEQVLRTGVPLRDIIVVDDGGSDDTRTALQDLQGVKYVWQPNAGPASARNNGARVAMGNVLCFLDSDDEWPDGSMGRLLSQLEIAHDVEAVFADTSMGSDSTGFSSFIETYGAQLFMDLPALPGPGGLVLQERIALMRVLARRNVMFLGSLLVRRETFARVGGFDEDLRGAADWEFFMRLTLEASVAFSPGSPPSRYIKHDAGMSTDQDHMDRDFILALERIHGRPSLPTKLRSYITEQLRRHRFGFAYQAYDRGELATARRRFVSAARTQGPVASSLAYAALASLPRPIVSLVRSARRRLRG